MPRTDTAHVQIEFSASSKGVRCSPRSRLVTKLQVDVGRLDPHTLEVAATPDMSAPDITFTRDVVCSYTGFHVGSVSASANTHAEHTKDSQLFEANAILAKYYHRPRRYRDNYVALLRRKLAASSPNDLPDEDDLGELLEVIVQQQKQAAAIGRGMRTALARRLARQACWLPVRSCGRLMVSITRLAIAHLIPKLLLGLQGVRPVEQQLDDIAVPAWRLLRAAWRVGADVSRQRKHEQIASGWKTIDLDKFFEFRDCEQ